jgi:hypothetical protein
MKYSIFLLVICFGTACQNNSSKNGDSSGDSTEFQLQGAYSMIKQVGNDGTKDTLLKKEQLKIYSDQYMMYASPRATDSFGEYGIALYKRRGNEVSEYIFYTSSAGEVRDTALLEITKLPNGYRQAITYHDSSSTFTITEDYDRVGKEPRTALDGAWRQVKNIQIDDKGDTTSSSVVNQFKVYESGYFIWANPTRDPSSNNFRSIYGYGTYKWLNNKETEEVNISSTFSSLLVGKPVKIDIEFDGTDKYKQTIMGPKGEKSVEVYDRLK